MSPVRFPASSARGGWTGPPLRRERSLFLCPPGTFCGNPVADGFALPLRHLSGLQPAVQPVGGPAASLPAAGVLRHVFLSPLFLSFLFFAPSLPFLCLSFSLPLRLPLLFFLFLLLLFFSLSFSFYRPPTGISGEASLVQAWWLS